MDPGANERFMAEARLFAKFGFYPVSESGTSTTRGPGMASIWALGIIAFGRRTTSSTTSVLFRREQPAQPAAPSAPTIPDQIRALGELRDAGLLTAEEFNAKKAELLARM
jgi:Short C-terminal domain